MDISISKLLGEGTLPQELTQTLQEAFDKKVETIRESLEVSIREEFAQRYEHDKNDLIEAMNAMLTEVATRHEEEKAKTINEFAEARDAFRSAKKNLGEKFKAKVNENKTVSRNLVMKTLSEEVVKLRQEKKKLVDAKLAAADQIAEAKAEMQADMKKRLQKMDEFVIRQVTRELSELHEDHKALIETRVKLVSESRTKLRETTSSFVKEAAKNVERVINETLRNEMTQLHEDLERNRQNLFGRRIFEAVAAEFMTSHLNEGSEIDNLSKVLEARNSELSQMKQQLDEAVKVSQQATRKAQLAEERATRNKIMSELLSNLRGEKRSVMEGMLDTVKTGALRESFNKLLPVVLNEKEVKIPAKKPLVENRSNGASNIVTGDHRNIITEDTLNTINDDTADIIRLAGINK